MNPDKREAERQWQRESYGSTEDGELETLQKGTWLAFYDASLIDSGKDAIIESDTWVKVRDSL